MPTYILIKLPVRLLHTVRGIIFRFASVRARQGCRMLCDNMCSSLGLRSSNVNVMWKLARLGVAIIALTCVLVTVRTLVLTPASTRCTPLLCHCSGVFLLLVVRLAPTRVEMLWAGCDRCARWQGGGERWWWAHSPYASCCNARQVPGIEVVDICSVCRRQERTHIASSVPAGMAVVVVVWVCAHSPLVLYHWTQCHRPTWERGWSADCNVQGLNISVTDEKQDAVLDNKWNKHISYFMWIFTVYSERIQIGNKVW
jgi:hypothetical protein